MRLHSIQATIAIATLTLATACSDSDDWTPGPEEAAGAIAYFPEQSAYKFTLMPDDDHTIPVLIARNSSAGEATVALTCTSSVEGVSLPTSVTFHDGEKTTYVPVDCSNVPLKTTAQISLAINDPLVYGAGSAQVDLTVNTTAGWIRVADLTCYFEASFEPIHTDLMVLDGTTNFKFVNVLNSGLDLPFTLTSTARTEIKPTANFEDADSGYGEWYLYDEANSTYPQWSPNGNDKIVVDAMAYGGSYTWIDLSEGSGCLAFVFDYADGTWEYNYVHFYFTMEYNPFE